MKATIRNRNLFIRAHEAQHGSNFDRIGTGWEDTLTDQFAFLLAADNRSRDAVVRNLLGPRVEPVTRIDTQVQHETGCPDLQLELTSGRLLLLEHKVDASLGHDQLDRYLEVVDDKGRPALVALISLKHLGVHEAVLNNERYLRPTDGAHWFWTDVYNWIPKPDAPFGGSWIRRCFREYFELLGFSPPDLVGKWKELLSHDRQFNSVREQFGKRLSLIRAHLSEKGFKITRDSHSGLNAVPPSKGKPYHHLTVGPAWTRRDHMDQKFAHQVSAAVLRIALVYDSRDTPPDALGRFNRFDGPIQDENGFLWYPVAPHRMTNRRTRLPLVSSLGQFLEDETSIAEKLLNGFVAVERALIEG